MSKLALRNLNQYLPPQMRLTPTVIQSVGIWGGTAALGAIWLVQPFTYIRTLMGGQPAEEESGQASAGQPSPPAPEKPDDKEGDEDSSSGGGGVDEGEKQEGAPKAEGGDKEGGDEKKEDS
ncbi:g1474 [Coccomyxa viridis]|uniref:G1474 protein n=1 Tax=Coccomyxa viridis TaxID=1274662 RepID=A0ABP1FI35_9CHLO